jgi:hypothetical protein
MDDWHQFLGSVGCRSRRRPNYHDILEKKQGKTLMTAWLRQVYKILKPSYY